MRLAIVGSRQYPSLATIETYIRTLPAGTEIVSGGAPGVDRAAATYAGLVGLAVKEFKADWSKGRGAGMARNGDIVDYADSLVAFWDGSSPGTANSIERAIKAGKLLGVVYPKTTVVHVNKAPFDTYIGRAGRGYEQSLFCNPFKIDKQCARNEAIVKFQAYFEADSALQSKALVLKGRVLGCWCKPDSCHGDILVEYLER